MNSLNYFNLLLEFMTLISLISALCVITSTNPILAIVFLIVLFVNVGVYLILMGLQFIGLSYLLVYVGAITVLFLFIIMMLNLDVASTVEVGKDFSKLLPLMYFISILFLVLFLSLIPSFFIDFTSGNLLTELYSSINTLIFRFKEEIFSFSNDPAFLSSLLFEPNFLYYNVWINTIVESYNFSDFSLINLNTFGDPSTLLYKNLQIQTLGEAIYGSYSILLIFSGFLLLLAMVCPIILARSASNNATSK